MAVYLAGVVAIVLVMSRIPDEQAALRGNVGGVLNGAAGAAALLAAYALRIRDWRVAAWCNALQSFPAFGASPP